MELLRGRYDKGLFKTLPADVKLYTLFNNHVPPACFYAADLRALGKAMRDVASSRVSAMAGYTYLGQFLAHDLSRLRIESHNNSVKSFTTDILRSNVSVMLDLSNVYDGATAGSLMRETNSARMALGAAELPKGELLHGHDLPRNGLLACIGDDRDDENLIVSQLHLQFLRLHNFFVDRIQSDQPGLDVETLFKAAKEQVILHYQEVILYDFLYEILDPAVWQAVIYENNAILWKPKPTEPAVLPIEYAAAAGRFGHAMVQNSYNLNQITSVVIDDLFKMTGPGKFAGAHTRMPATHLVDWRLFFDFPGYDYRGLPLRNHARSISPRVRVDLQNTESLPAPEEQDLATRNLLRGFQMGLGSGQTAVHYLLTNFQSQLTGLNISLKPLNIDELNLNISAVSQDVLNRCSPSLSYSTPLWYYILAEAFRNTVDRIVKLGPLGSLIVAESVRGLIQLDGNSLMYRKRRRQDIKPTKQIKGLGGVRLLQMSDLILAANSGVYDPTTEIATR